MPRFAANSSGQAAPIAANSSAQAAPNAANTPGQAVPSAANDNVDPRDAAKGLDEDPNAAKDPESGGRVVLSGHYRSFLPWNVIHCQNLSFDCSDLCMC